jgi:hypothetical protein
MTRNDGAATPRLISSRRNQCCTRCLSGRSFSDANISTNNPSNMDSSANIPIKVSVASEPNTFVVEVMARTTTRHRVTVDPAYLTAIGIERVPAETVLREAFRFLLEREPNTSVLTHFDLQDIERYFPEFRVEISRRTGG